MTKRKFTDLHITDDEVEFVASFNEANGIDSNLIWRLPAPGGWLYVNNVVRDASDEGVTVLSSSCVFIPDRDA